MEYFHRDILTQPSLICWKNVMYVRMLKRELKNRPRNLRPVRRCFLSTFALITCRSFIILNFICARRASQIQVRRLLYVKFKRQWKSTFITIFLNTKLRNMQHQMFLHKLLLKAKKLKRSVAAVS